MADAAEKTMPSTASDWRYAVALFIAAVSLRAMLLMIGVRAEHLSVSEDAFLAGRDSHSYLVCAQRFAGEAPVIDAYDRRVFPGFPALIAGLHLLGIPVVSAGLALSWTGSALAALWMARLYGDWRLAVAAVFLIPQYLIATASVMNEGVLIALCTAGLICGLKGRAVAAGLLLGLAGAVRPNAVFAFAGLIICLLLRRQRREAAIATISAAAMIVLATLLLWKAFGDPFANVKGYNTPGAYNGHILTWPFLSLVSTPLKQNTPLWKIAYTWLHVLLAVSACAIWVWRWARSRSAFDAASAIWLLGNTAFVLCMGSNWGFSGFARGTAWALPPLLAAYSNFWPRRWWAWIFIAAPAIGVSVYFFVRTPRGSATAETNVAAASPIVRIDQRGAVDYVIGRGIAHFVQEFQIEVHAIPIASRH